MKLLPLIVLTSFVAAPLAFAADADKKAATDTTPAAAAAMTPTPSPTATPDVPIGPLKNQKEKASYAIGLDIGTTMKRQSIDISEDLMAKGVHDGLTDAKPLLTQEQSRAVMSTFQKDMMEKQAAVRKAEGEKNAEEGKKFLEENKKKPGVKTTASGLQYKVIAEGKGNSPKETDTVEVNYRGTLIDGTEFDSSYKRGKPAKFPVNRVIKGWTEGLQLMKPGGKYIFYIPPDLAYGERGAGSEIGPESTLVFDVELLGVSPASTTPVPKPGMMKPGMTPVKPESGKPSASPSPTATKS
jgi:FKBP-type peptidyl-prolyl cis-trans isomerase FklB